jgi:hypothetical protein
MADDHVERRAERSDGDVREASALAERWEVLEASEDEWDSPLEGRGAERAAGREARGPPLSSQERPEGVIGAKGGTRTPTVLLPPAPQAGASANSATFAKRAGIQARPIEAASLKPNRHSSTRRAGARSTQAAENVGPDGGGADQGSAGRAIR